MNIVDFQNSLKPGDIIQYRYEDNIYYKFIGFRKCIFLTSQITTHCKDCKGKYLLKKLDENITNIIEKVILTCGYSFHFKKLDEFISIEEFSV